MTIEYNLDRRVINADFITSKMKKADKLIIRYNAKGSILEIKGKDDKGKDDSVLYEIPLENIKGMNIISQRQFQERDKLIQVVFVEGKQHTRIIRVNIRDQEIDGLICKINELRRRDKDDQLLKICSGCGGKNSKESKFCNLCGCKLQFPCLECGNINPEGFNYCPSCGVKLDKNQNLALPI